VRQTGSLAIPVVCAIANAVAALALASVLAPGTTLVADPAAREAYIQEHLLLWRAGWATWILATTSLVALFVWWTRRLAPHPLHVFALGLAGAAYVSDMTAQTLLITVVPDRPAVMPLAFALTGGITNTLYTLAGIVLSVLTPMRPPLRVWTAGVWLAGAGVSVSVLFDLPLAAAATSAALFLLFVPWCIALGRALSR
jgi:hypothetical protein